MKSSRSRRTDLNALSKEESRTTQSTQQPSKGYGFSLFGRTKPSKLSRASTEENDNKVATTGTDTHEEGPTRLSLASRHYRTMSRSMNDLGAMTSRADLSDPLQFNQKQYKVPGQIHPNSLTSGTSETLDNVAEPEEIALEPELAPFPLSSIALYGWLNKRSARKESSWKLHQVYVS